MHVVSIVGRPNVGKSTLFNRIIGKRESIVDNTPGVTRDRLYREASWGGKDFMLVDTGGIEAKTNELIPAKMRESAEIAISLSDVIVFLADVRAGVLSDDFDVAKMLQKSGKRVVLACNKVDNPGNPPNEIYEFYNLGLGEPFPVSSSHGLGLGDLLDEVTRDFEKTEDETDDNTLNVAIIGKPNVGKSSLVNRLLGEERVIVSDIPGTTRDSVDTMLVRDGVRYNLIDTAGMRKKGKIDDSLERYSVIRALSAVDRSDVCLVLIDALEGVTEQDTKIAGYAHDRGKPSVVVINKWDLVKGTGKAEYKKRVLERLKFMAYAPVMFISALTGQWVNDLFPSIVYVNEKNCFRAGTGALNDILNEAVQKVQPPSDKGKRLKVYYITQASTKPPTFILFINKKDLCHYSYLRYIENQIREAFMIDAAPVRFILREKQKEV